MKIKTAHTKKLWVSQNLNATENNETNKPSQDSGTELIQRALTEVIRCQNLVVLSGLGTSLCVPKAPKMQDLWEKVKSAYETEIRSPWTDLVALVKHTEESTNIEELLSQCKMAEIFLSDTDQLQVKTFIQLAEREIRQAVNFVAPSDELSVHSTFIQKIARRSSGKGRAKIFTTNYDLCFERAAKDGRFVVIDGFSPTLPPTFDPVYFSYDIVRRGSEANTSAFIPNVFHLYKMHGSIDWELCESEGVIEKKHNTESPLLIYPRSSKYEQAFSQPYLEMMSAFQTALREPNTGLLIVGFGFKDNHIAEPILSAIKSNLGLKVVVVDPYLVKDIDAHRFIQDGGERGALNEDDELIDDLGLANKNIYLNKIVQMIDRGDARLTFLNGTFEEVTNEMPDMVAATDLEKHMGRVRSIESETT